MHWSFDAGTGPPSAPWIYDGYTGLSRTNGHSLAFSSASPSPATVPFHLTKGFTLEILFRPIPDRVEKSSSRENILRLIPRDCPAPSLDLHMCPGPNSRSPHKLGGGVTPVEGPFHRLHRVFSSGLSHAQHTTDWRHMALVYHADKAVVSSYLDYRLLDQCYLAAEDLCGAYTLTLGEEGRSYRSWMDTDEVQIRPVALAPHQFMRPARQSIHHIHFSNPDLPRPVEAVHHDIRLHYGAVGNGIIDDTEAFRQAFRTLSGYQPASCEVLYIPPGTYRITGPLSWRDGLVLQGAGRDLSVIRLDDSQPGFMDPAHPAPLLHAGGGTRTAADPHPANYLFDLTLDTSTGNPGAIGLVFSSNPEGTMERVRIRSVDGTGSCGLQFPSTLPGPAFMQDVLIEGFNVSYRVLPAKSPDLNPGNKRVNLKPENKATPPEQSIP